MFNVSWSKMFTKFWLLSHSFGSRHASKSVNGSKNADYRLDSKKAWSKEIAYWVDARSQVTSAKNARKHALIMTSHTDHKPKRKTYFSISTRRLAVSVGGLNSSPAQSSG